MRPLIWLRNDLRVRDHLPLFEAAKKADRGVVAVFIICPEQWDEHDMAPIKVDFILRTLKVVRDDLEKRNIPLLIRTTPRFEGVPKLLTSLAKKHECDALYFGEEYEVNERRRDHAVRTAFRDDDLAVHTFTDQVLRDPDAIRTTQGDFYTVFSPFKRAWINRVNDEGRAEPVGLPKKQDAMVCESDEIPDSVDGFERRGRPDLWPAGEHEARKRLKWFIDGPISAYKDQRDFPDRDGTSKLSPHLAIGSISIRECFEAGVNANNNSLNGRKTNAATWISELIWREFYRHILIGFPRVSRGRAFRLETEELEWDDNDEHFDAWCNGRTGIPIVDAAMRQLLATGWMHNRLRMIVAMFLTKDLFQNWRKGETFFMRHLIDGDLASNNGGWQWSASTGTDAAPYFRIFNPFTQSRKFDPEGDFIREWVPELKDVEGDAIHDPSDLPDLLRSKLDYPLPIVDRSKSRDRVLAAFKALKG